MDLSAIELLKEAVQSGASDLFIVTGLPASVRLNGKIVQISSDPLKLGDTDAIITQMYELAHNRTMDGLDMIIECGTKREGELLEEVSAAGHVRSVSMIAHDGEAVY